MRQINWTENVKWSNSHVQKHNTFPERSFYTIQNMKQNRHSLWLGDDVLVKFPDFLVARGSWCTFCGVFSYIYIYIFGRCMANKVTHRHITRIKEVWLSHRTPLTQPTQAQRNKAQRMLQNLANPWSKEIKPKNWNATNLSLYSEVSEGLSGGPLSLDIRCCSGERDCLISKALDIVESALPFSSENGRWLAVVGKAIGE